MAIILINNTAEDLPIPNTTITIPASGEYRVLGGIVKDELRTSDGLYSLMMAKKISVSNGEEVLPGVLGLGLLRDFMDDPNTTSSNFTLNVAAGNVPGLSTFYSTGYGLGIGTTYKDIWMAPGTLSLPTTNESYEIVSSSVNDTLLGTGARVVAVTTLDPNNNEQTQLVNLNGTTPVQLTGTHSFPMGSMTVVSSGSLRSNAGNITLRVSGGGATRNYMTIDESNALSAIFKIPANRVLMPVTLDFHTGGAAKPVTVRIRVMLPGTNTWVSTAVIPFIENSFTTSFKATFEFPAGTIVKYQAKLDSGSDGSVALILSSYRRDIS